MKSWVRLAAVALFALTAPVAALAQHGEREWGARAQQERAEPRERPAYGAPGGRGGYYGPGFERPAPQAYPPARAPFYRSGGGYPAYPGYRAPSYGSRGYAAPRYAPPSVAYGRWRRGQILPPAYRGDVIADFGRYHLRRPPRGYYWVREGDDFVLVAIGTGLIFDVISGGY